MTVFVQDDARERELRQLFNLVRPEDYGRADVDGILELEGPGVPGELHGRRVPFELKSATGGKPDISTVRDFGLHHIEKWRPLHWIFGVYNGAPLTLQYSHYASPAQMKPWFDQMTAYVLPDVRLAEVVPRLMDDSELAAILGDADDFGPEEARRLMKNQYKRADYHAASDLPEGRYSREAMLQMLRERSRYVIQRGSTLNNPHIPASYFAAWERIERNHAARLRELVLEALEAEG